MKYSLPFSFLRSLVFLLGTKSLYSLLASVALQNRYVKYFEKLKIFYNCSLPPRKVLTIKRFIIYSIHGDGSDLKVQIIMQHNIVFSCSSCKNCMIFHDIEIDKAIINLVNCPELYDDVKVKFLSKALPAYYDDCPFFFWFHTSFIQYNRLYLPRHELDNLHKPKTWKIYPTEFAVEVQFDEISQSSTATSTQLSRVSLVGQKDAVGSP
uniref:C2 tensin-type domain-containing protein n=1 Tax=Castor canadensis TaxID=51338 RepID=A0A8C0WYA0_CASCN